MQRILTEQLISVTPAQRSNFNYNFKHKEITQLKSKIRVILRKSVLTSQGLRRKSTE